MKIGVVFLPRRQRKDNMKIILDITEHLQPCSDKLFFFPSQAQKFRNGFQIEAKSDVIFMWQKGEMTKNVTED